ncbi:glycosyltransferase family 4 protein [Chthonobacter rhizosphaerae]|uniref:glycosyltransferase family 4 protein n=1 Tax=Chthonobacter rhizosphaerae TaxID=2735553 RepID=UPI0015EE5DBE|nr:glycosyltransferase family 4 protein [Chthonobacter rhizosphaerae]
MTSDGIVFAIPGDLHQRTGGYGYDRRLMAALAAGGLPVRHLRLAVGFPAPTRVDLQHADAALADLPDGATVLIDGLAYAAMPDAMTRHAGRLRLVGLCHHPLALETGLDAATAAAYRASEAAALKACRAVVVTSPATAAILADLFAYPADRIAVAVPGTDPRPPAPCRGDPPVLLTVATLTRRKAHDVLVRALAAIADLPWRARFVGGDGFDPAWAASLRALVAEHGLGDRVAFVGSVDDATDELMAADVFVLPSRFEGYGMAFAEAMAHGLPVVAARAGAVPDVVPEAAGALVPPDDVDALADALRRLLSDRDLYERARAGSRRAGEALPTWTDTAAIVRRLLERVSG